MVHFQDQLADLGLEFLVVGLQLTFSLRRFLDKAVAQILLTPPFDQASGDLIVSCCLRRAQLPGLDLFDQLAFEGGLEPTIVSFSHISISNSLTARSNAGRKGLWKVPHRWKSAKNADSHTTIGKASHKTARLSHTYHS